MKLKTIGIGSLPHYSIEKAVAYSLKHDLPFLPQMTSLNERMIEQVLSLKEPEEKYKALSCFTEKILENKILEFKIQIAGPCTCNASETVILKEIDFLLNYFDQYKLRPIVFIDEPIIKENSLALGNVFLELQKKKVITGLHSCAKFNWKKIEKYTNDFISFDIDLMKPDNNSSKKLVTGIPPFSKNIFIITGEYISSSCGLASYSEDDCEIILDNLNLWK